MKPNKENIEAALLDVRKSYRLLHDYQRMVLDAVGYIASQFGMSYEGGWPRFSGPPPRSGQGRFNNWSWDWLNMMFYEFHFYREIGTDEWVGMSILLISDTGYFCAKDNSLHRNDVTAYLPADQSDTKIAFLMTPNEYPDMQFLGEKKPMKSFIENDELPSEITKSGMIGRIYDFDHLISEERTNALIDDITGWANHSGIKLERIKHHDSKY